MKVKAGYRTSEFWFTLVSFIFSGLYLTGILVENDQKEELIEVVSHAVESCILIGGQLVILYKYVNGRTKIKEQAQKITIEEHELDVNRNKTTKRRTNQKRSGKANSNSQGKTKRSPKSSG